MNITPEIRAMNGIELAIRRVSSRLKNRDAWNMDVTGALDELAEEIASMSNEAIAAINQQQRGKE